MSVARASVELMIPPKAFSAPAQVFRAVELDASQRRVADMPLGESAAVLGAPGSGKTATLIELVARRVERDGFAPESILVLTPQRLAANRLRLALAQRLRVATNGPLARTPMSVAFSLATEGAFARGVDVPRMLTGAEHDQVLSELLADRATSGLWAPGLDHDVVQSQTFRTELRDLLARCVESGLTHADLERLGREQGRPEWVAAAAFWHGPLENTLAFNRQNDFDAATLMRQAVVSLADPAVMAHVRMVVVDDAQELTRGAINLLRAFASRGVPVVIFGDPDTSATTFRGAIPAVLGEFSATVVPGAARYSLDFVYRHGAAIRGAVSKLTGLVGTALAVEQRAALAAPGVAPGDISFVERESLTAEIAAVGRLLRERRIHDKIKYSEMVVVVRSGSLVPQVARLLGAHEIPTRTLASEQNLRDKTITRALLQLIQVSLNPHKLTVDLTPELLTGPLGGLSVIEVRRLRQVLRHAEIAKDAPRRGDELLRAELLTAGGFSDIEMNAAKRASRLAATIAQLREMASAGASVEELLWAAWNGSPAAKSWPQESAQGGILGHEANRNLDAVLELFTMAKRSVEREPDRPPADFVEAMLRAELPEDTLTAAPVSESVLVCTPAALIGDEYKVVAIAAVQEGAWPNLRLRGSLLHAQAITDPPLATDDLRQQVRSDELRMFALAASRATQHLIVSGVTGSDSLVSPFGRYIEPLATRTVASAELAQARATYPLTLRGMSAHLRRQLTSAIKAHGADSPQARAAAAAVAKLAENDVAGAHPSSWFGVAGPSTDHPVAVLDGDTPETVSVSPSRLEKWQDNQLAWFLSTTVGYEGSAQTGIGTLLHAVFENVVRNTSGERFTGEALFAEIEPRWSDLEFDAVWESNNLKRRVRGMCESLAGYLNEFAASGREVVGVECSFALPFGQGSLNGRADRLESDADGAIQVVDLKSSKNPKSGPEVKKDLQLACYQYALVNGGFKIVNGKVAERNRDDESDVPPYEPQVSGGASLLFLNNVDSKGVYSAKSLPQSPLPPAAPTGSSELSLEGMREMLELAVTGMASGVYSATVYTREVDGEYNSSWSTRIHTVRAVSS
jgi:superfamily I DNA/RNA helicase/RecB family exonuclease